MIPDRNRAHLVPYNTTYLERDVALRLKQRGVHVLLSNSSAPWVRELYADFRVEEVRATRMVNSQPSGRGKIAELLIW